MKKIYNSIECKIVEISTSDIIATSLSATVDTNEANGIIGSQALTPGREFDEYGY